jgi:uncharacterized membrane protein
VLGTTVFRKRTFLSSIPVPWEKRMRKCLFIFVFMLVSPAYAIEKMDCVGTEPFWNATLSDDQVAFEVDGATRRYPSPKYSPAAGHSPNYVLSVQAKDRTSNLTAFTVNQTIMNVADKNGKPPSDRKEYESYCSDQMSALGFPYSIHLIVDHKIYTGCCWTRSNPRVGED